MKRILFLAKNKAHFFGIGLAALLLVASYRFLSLSARYSGDHFDRQKAVHATSRSNGELRNSFALTAASQVMADPVLFKKSVGAASSAIEALSGCAGLPAEECSRFALATSSIGSSLQRLEAPRSGQASALNLSIFRALTPEFEKFSSKLAELEEGEWARTLAHQKEFVSATSVMRWLLRLIDVLLVGVIVALAWSSKRRAAAEDARKRSEALHRAIFECMSDVAIVLDHKGKIIACNDPASQMLGRPAHELSGISIFSLDFQCVDEDGEAVTAECWPIALTLRQSTVEQRVLGIRLKTGPLRWFQVCSRPIEKEKPNLGTEAAVLTANDITDKQLAQFIMNEQRAKMVTASKMAALGEMASAMAHEINNPLAIISGKAGVLHELADSGQLTPHFVAETADKIQATTLRIARIVKGLRTFARDGEQDDFQLASLYSIVEDTLDLCGEKLQQERVQLVVEPIAESLEMECRPTQLSQVLLNLIMNARDAVLEHSQGGWIRISPRDLDTHVELSVIDSGPGISPKIAERIFTPFFTTKDVGKGTGLGLSVSKGIIDMHKGTLTLDARSSNTRFVIKIPKKQARSKEAA